MIVLVISTGDSTGLRRRDRLNFDYDDLRTAVTPRDVSPRMRRINKHYRMCEHTASGRRTARLRRGARMACFESHLEVMRYIIQRGLKHVVVCEDDAVMLRKLPSAERLGDNITLLGGRLAGPGAWLRQRSEWLESGAALQVYASLRRGLNEIDYERYRWCNTVSYYVPNCDAAQRVLDAYEASRKGDVGHYDIFLSNNRLVTHLWFPPVFAEWARESSIGSQRNGRWNELYCDYERLRPSIAKAHGLASCEGDRLWHRVSSASESIYFLEPQHHGNENPCDETTTQDDTETSVPSPASSKRDARRDSRGTAQFRQTNSRRAAKGPRSLPKV